MKRLAVFTLTLMVIAGSAAAQPDTLWTQHYGTPWVDWCTSLAYTSDEGFALSGYAQQDSAGDYYFFLLKTDADGDSLWQYYYGMEMVDFYGKSVNQTSDGGYVIAGYAGEDPDIQAVLLRTDATGDSLWMGIYGGPTNEQFESVVECDDGGFICLGHTDASGEQQTYLMKIDADGNTLWTHAYGDENTQYGYSVIALENGNYMAAGYTYVTVPFSYIPFMIEIDADGDSLWGATYPSANSSCYDIKQTDDGGFITALSWHEGFFTIDAAGMKVADDGSQEWLTVVSGQEFRSVAEAADGNYVFVGNTSTMAPPQATLMAKLSSSGSVIWSLQLEIGTSLEWGQGIVQTSDGGYAIAGTYWGVTGESNQMYLTRFGAEITPSVTISLTPVNPPIVIPASGGSFDYNAVLINDETSPTSLDVWVMVQLPNGNWYGPVLGPVNLTLPGSQSLSRERTQAVPARAPAGTYTYEGRLGIYPGIIWANDSFSFEKTAGDDGGSPVSAWSCWGEPFDDLEGAGKSIPNGIVLLNAYPNPFNPTTTLRFALPQAMPVNLSIYDITGALVATLVDGWRDAGSHEATFQAGGLASGVYLYKLSTDGYHCEGKIVLTK